MSLNRGIAKVGAQTGLLAFVERASRQPSSSADGRIEPSPQALPEPARPLPIGRWLLAFGDALIALTGDFGIPRAIQRRRRCARDRPTAPPSRTVFPRRSFCRWEHGIHDSDAIWRTLTRKPGSTTPATPGRVGEQAVEFTWTFGYPAKCPDEIGSILAGSRAQLMFSDPSRGELPSPWASE